MTPTGKRKIKKIKKNFWKGSPDFAVWFWGWGGVDMPPHQQRKKRRHGRKRHQPQHGQRYASLFVRYALNIEKQRQNTPPARPATAQYRETRHAASLAQYRNICIYTRPAPRKIGGRLYYLCLCLYAYMLTYIDTYIHTYI